MVDSRNIFAHARLHPSMEILLVLTEWPPPTHFCHAVSIPKEITIHNTIVINMMKIILQEYKKVMTILTILWITKLIRRIYFTLDYKADCEDS
jgi:hypothetical protein